MHRYKLVAVDMDGTLLKSDKTLHPDTIRDIEQAAKQDLQTVYCSGRSVIEIKPYLSDLPSIRYGICCSGSVVYDFKEDRKIFSKEIPAKYAVIASNIAKKYDAMPHFLAENSTACIHHVTHMDDYNMGVYQPLFLKVAKHVEDMSAEAACRFSIPKVNLYFREKAHRQAAYEELKNLPLEFATVGDTVLEMTAPGVSKALGVRVLANRLGLKMKEIAGIGDSDNDREMLSTVGFPVAMGNAEEEILKMCRLTVADNDHNGVGEAIRKLMEG